MKKMLRKTAVHLYVSYRSGNFTNNLSGENVTLDSDGRRLVLTIDMARNLRTRNTSENRYLDALELIEKAHDVRLVQLTDKQVIDGLEFVWQKIESPELELVLQIGEENRHAYRVKPESPDGQALKLHVVGSS